MTPSCHGRNYAHFIPCREVGTLQKNGILGMTLNWIGWWGFSSGECLHCLWPGVVVHVCVLSIDQIDLFANYLYNIGICDTI